MQDLFKSYHRHKVLSHLGVLSLSILCAVSINTFVLSGDTGQYLKASVLDVTTSQETPPDFSTDVNSENIIFQNTKTLSHITGLSFSLAYDPEKLELGDMTAEISGADIQEIKNESGFASYILSFQSPIDIPAMTPLTSLQYKKLNTGTIYLNSVNVNFTDNKGNIYNLSSEGTIF